VLLLDGMVAVTNAPMRKLLDMIDADHLPPPAKVVLRLAEGGTTVVGDCLLFSIFARLQQQIPRSGFKDDVGYEAFINHFHLQGSSEMEALRMALSAVSTLAPMVQRGASERSVRFIIGIDGASSSVRFHVVRPGASWLTDGLEGYEEPVLFTDVHATRSLPDVGRAR
jgi:hypothetical protein